LEKALIGGPKMDVLRQRRLARVGWILVFGGALVFGGSVLSTAGPTAVRALCVADGVGTNEDGGGQCESGCAEGTVLDGETGDCVAAPGVPPATGGVPESDGSSAGTSN
jgi:hypothetical protein